ncbi:MAG TPA: SdrD B-like domain-containing protein, partial [Candidatus Limiplasma sp.]|nr:SdrD B-like domain-containing protein [Candidatus Limiplasma sp.]
LLLLLFICTLLSASAESLGYFTGRVWNDLNNNGLMDPEEPLIPGVTLHLLRDDTGELLTAVSDETGTYLFSDLPNDSYKFSVEFPQAMLLARYTSEGDLRSILTGDDENNYRSFIVRYTDPRTDMNVGLVDSAIIRGITYLDMNYNGNYDEGEPPYGGLKLQFIRNYVDRPVQEVISGSDGVFEFDYVRTGNYRFRAIVPDDGSAFTLVPANPGYFSNLFAPRDGRRENSVEDIDVENGMVYEYYIGVTLGGQISGSVFNDKDYSGAYNGADSAITGVTVQLIDKNGEVVSQINTNKNGDYTLADVMPGTYTLRFVRKDGYTFTKYRPMETGGNDAILSVSGLYGETEPFSIAMSETLTDFNAGMVQAATLGGVFFYDENDNGLMDAAETGFTEGRVRLVSTDGEIDLTQPVNADGSYLFNGVAPTDYTLYYLLPEHAEMAKVAKGGNTLAHQGAENAVTNLTLQAKKSYTQPLVGAVKLGTFEGYAFTDRNANGIQDEGEAPLAGVTVSVAPSGAPEAAVSAVTDETGVFSVTGLRPGDYNLNLQLPDGLIFAGNIEQSGIQLDRTSTYSAPILFSTLLRRTHNAIGAVAPASLQANVWLDENLSGARDDGEPGVSGLSYTLFDEIRQQTVMTALSGEDGSVLFENIRPSAYTVSFVLPTDSSPVSGVGTMAASGGNMAQSGIALSAGDAYTDVSTGIVSTTSLGGIVLADRTGGRAPVQGVEVLLYREGDSSPLQTAVSDENGMYRFDGLWPGSYQLEVVRPDGYVFTRPGDPMLSPGDSAIAQIGDTSGYSASIVLHMAQDQLHQNILFTIPAKVGSLVWLDENANGLIDGTEPMIGGVTINLLQNGEAVYTTTSNEWGYYEFPDVYPGEYTLQAYAYPELDITAQVPAVPIISSCLALGDGSIAASEPFTVESQTVNFMYHLGYVLKRGKSLPEDAIHGTSKDWTFGD